MPGYDLQKPCDNCPFLRVGGIRLHPARVREIAGGMLNPGGGEFVCHKYTRETNEGESVPLPNAQHCAGALIFAEKAGNATQMMRIAERLGWYNAGRLMDDAGIVGSVFDDLDEMISTNRKECHGKRQPK